MPAPRNIVKLEWKGEKLLKSMNRAEARAAGFVIAKCVAYAKRNHPGWKNVTGTARNSVRKISLTRVDGKLEGEWGSTKFYVRFLEMFHGSFLRNSADVNYPMLRAKISEFFNEQNKAGP